MKLSSSDLVELVYGEVAILGGGVSGLAAQKLIIQKGGQADIFDEKGKEFTLNHARKCSLVIRSPGFRPDHPWLRTAEMANKVILTEIDLGAIFSEHQYLLAITGTNGKTSLTTILAHVCGKLGIDCEIAGNIGTPLCELILQGKTRGKIIFLEMSSFQAVSIQRLSPDAVIWTNFAEDHLDYHSDEKNYFNAKKNLLRACNISQNTWIGKSVREAATRLGIELGLSHKEVLPIDLDEIPETIPPFLKTFPQRENLALAQSWFLSRGFSSELFFRKLTGYKEQPYRLSKVETVKGVHFWNDSKSTNLASVISACKSFKEKLFWIGGGRNKGQRLDEFAVALKPFISKAFLFGECSKNLHRSFQSRGLSSIICQDLKHAVKLAFQWSKRSENIVFSPGFASFDLYLNYEARGNSFNQLVFDLKSTEQMSTNLCLN